MSNYWDELIKVPLGGKYGIGKFALVSSEDQWVLNFKWYCHNLGYAARAVREGKKVRRIWMHREINQTPEGYQTDHINRNKLDNRRSNLRTVTTYENQANRGTPRNNTSGISGVTWDKHRNRWRVRYMRNGKIIYLGDFRSLTEAINTREGTVHV